MPCKEYYLTAKLQYQIIAQNWRRIKSGWMEGLSSCRARVFNHVVVSVVTKDWFYNIRSCDLVIDSYVVTHICMYYTSILTECDTSQIMLGEATPNRRARECRGGANKSGWTLLCLQTKERGKSRELEILPWSWVNIFLTIAWPLFSSLSQIKSIGHTA